MVRDPDEIILPILRDIRSEMAKMAAHMMTLSTEMTALRQHQGAVVTLQEHDHTEIAAIKVRLDRLERRLDIVE